MNVIDPSVVHHLMDGVPEGAGVTHAVKRYHEVAALYESPRDDDPVVYEVYTHDVGPQTRGNLLWGLTIMKPVDSHGECNMTRGHFHQDRDCTEYYFCLRGEGLLLRVFSMRGEGCCSRFALGAGRVAAPGFL